jgi:hypothetical protein
MEACEKGCEILRIPLCLGNRFTDGGKIISLTIRLRSTPQKHYVSSSGTYFCYRLSKPQGLLRLEGISKLKKCIHLRLVKNVFPRISVNIS